MCVCVSLGWVTVTKETAAEKNAIRGPDARRAPAR